MAPSETMADNEACRPFNRETHCLQCNGDKFKTQFSVGLSNGYARAAMSESAVEVTTYDIHGELHERKNIGEFRVVDDEMTLEWRTVARWLKTTPTFTINFKRVGYKQILTAYITKADTDAFRVSCLNTGGEQVVTVAMQPDSTVASLLDEVAKVAADATLVLPNATLLNSDMEPVLLKDLLEEDSERERDTDLLEEDSGFERDTEGQPARRQAKI